PDSPHDGGNSFRRVPSGVLVHGLEVVRPDHQNDEREGRVYLDPLFEAHEPVPAWLEGIVQDRTPPVQAIFDHPHLLTAGYEGEFHHTRPTSVEWQPAAGAGNNAPRERIRVDKDLMHSRRPQPVTQPPESDRNRTRQPPSKEIFERRREFVQLIHDWM